MATFHCDKWGRTKPVTISLPTRPGAQHQNDIVEQMVQVDKTSANFELEMTPTGKDVKRSQFEWLRSYGKEIKQLAGHSHSWKLVRLLNPAAAEQSETRASPASECRLWL